jgi:prophage regulatory protein
MQRIVRASGLREATGLGLTAIKGLMKRGEFPRPIHLTRKAVGWLESDIADWQQERAAHRDSEQPVVPPAP